MTTTIIAATLTRTISMNIIKQTWSQSHCSARFRRLDSKKVVHYYSLPHHEMSISYIIQQNHSSAHAILL
jgi:hypothetical protein